MRKGLKTIGSVALVAILIVGMCALLMPNTAFAKGKPKPPPCPCPDTIELPNGIVCELVACGFDCVYVCPFPF